MLKGAQIGRLCGVAGISVEGAVHRNMRVLLLKYPKERTGLTQIIKQKGGRWSQTFKSWYIPRDQAMLEIILKEAGAGFAQLYPEAAILIADMRRQIDLKGYSPATRKNYIQAITAFAIYFGSDLKLLLLPFKRLKIRLFRRINNTFQPAPLF